MLKKFKAKKTRAIILSENKVEIASTHTENIADRLDAINKVALVVKQYLKDGVDYGVIPGVKKPSLFKSGANKIKNLYGLRSQFTLLNSFEGIKNKIYVIEYFFKCELFTYKDEQLVAEGLGHISSVEKGKKNNPNNTLIKVCEKRALVDAITSLGGLSEIFTQDMEDDSLSTTNGQFYMSKAARLGIFPYWYRRQGLDKSTSIINQDKQKVKMKHKLFTLLDQLDLPSPLSNTFNKKHAQILKEFMLQEKEKEKNDK